MLDSKCPKCGGEIRCLAGKPAHPDNWYCKDEKGCGWQAWDQSSHAKTSPASPAGYLPLTMQQMIDAGLNAFAVQLLSESVEAQNMTKEVKFRYGSVGITITPLEKQGT